MGDIWSKSDVLHFQCITSRKGRIVHLGGQRISSFDRETKQHRGNVVNWPRTRRATTSLFRLILGGTSKWNDLEVLLSFLRTCGKRVQRPGFGAGPSRSGAPPRFVSFWPSCIGLNSSAESFDIELPSSPGQNFQSRVKCAYRPVGHDRSLAPTLRLEFDWLSFSIELNWGTCRSSPCFS